MISISYLSTVNTLTSSFKYIYNGAVITASNICHILRKWHFDNSRYIFKLKKRLNGLCATTVSSNVKEGVFCILQILRIHTGLWKCNKKDRFHIFFVTRIHWESNNHELWLQRMRCCLNNIELLLSGEKMQLILKGRMKSSVTDYFLISC